MSKQRDLTKDEYLWDGSGEPDAEVLRLERALETFRHAGWPPELPASLAATGELKEDLRGVRRWFQFAAVAARALLVLSVWVGLRLQTQSVGTGSEWGVQQIAGMPRVGTQAISGTGEKGALRVGQTLETDRKSRASIAVSDIGQVDIDPIRLSRLHEDNRQPCRDPQRRPGSTGATVLCVFPFAGSSRKGDNMRLRRISFLKYFAAIAGALLVFSTPAVAGPPLICHAIDIGSEQSLPWTSHGWNLSGQETYRVSHLVADTLGLLTSSTPVLVRMETLRRATLYGQQQTPVAKELLLRLEARTRENPKDALAAFDFGYLVECYRQAGWLRQHTDWLKASEFPTVTNLAMKVDGYEWVRKAMALRGSDPQMEFAAALMTRDGTRSEHDQHLRKALAGARADAMLARNLSSRFPKNAV